ncbi:Hypothetical protein PHPALM_8024 [Phytophthora palmivora]|uniref:Uncharacterized protein n=1 Tax=Phytophthora palmivora TaxID=4796 RepID=A0A2P4YAT9_9STRA|nr:Hypothetical protein PHPALM_8024 [Phytophthora palmivora]
MDGAKSTNVSMETRTEVEKNSGSVVEEKVTGNSVGQTTVDEVQHAFSFGEMRKYHKQWHPHFVSYLDGQAGRVETLLTTDLLVCVFCHENFAEFHPELFNGGLQPTTYPLVPVQLLALEFGEKNVLIVNEGFDNENHTLTMMALHMAGHSEMDSLTIFLLNNGEILFHVAGEDIVGYFNNLGYRCGSGQRVAQFLLNLDNEQVDQCCIMISMVNHRKSDFVKVVAVITKFASE